MATESVVMRVNVCTATSIIYILSFVGACPDVSTVRKRERLSIIGLLLSKLYVAYIICMCFFVLSFVHYACNT